MDPVNLDHVDRQRVRTRLKYCWIHLIHLDLHFHHLDLQNIPNHSDLKAKTVKKVSCIENLADDRITDNHYKPVSRIFIHILLMNDIKLFIFYLSKPKTKKCYFKLSLVGKRPRATVDRYELWWLYQSNDPISKSMPI